MTAAKKAARPAGLGFPARLSRIVGNHLPGRQVPYGSTLNPPSRCGVGLAGRQRPYGSRLQPALVQRLWTVVQTRAQRPTGAIAWVAMGRGGAAPDCCVPARGSEAASTRQSASEPMSLRVGLDIEISFHGGGSAAARMARRVSPRSMDCHEWKITPRTSTCLAGLGHFTSCSE